MPKYDTIILKLFNLWMTLYLKILRKIDFTKLTLYIAYFVVYKENNSLVKPTMDVTQR